MDSRIYTISIEAEDKVKYEIRECEIKDLGIKSRLRWQAEESLKT